MRQITKRLRKNKRSNLIALSLVLLMSACGSSKMFEAYNTLDGNAWGENAVQSFEFEIADESKTLDLYFTIKNGLAYPYHNLYVKYRLLRKEGENEQLVSFLGNH